MTPSTRNTLRFRLSGSPASERGLGGDLTRAVDGHERSDSARESSHSDFEGDSMIEYQTVFEAAPWGWRVAASVAIHSALILAAVAVRIRVGPKEIPRDVPLRAGVLFGDDSRLALDFRPQSRRHRHFFPGVAKRLSIGLALDRRGCRRNRTPASPIRPGADRRAGVHRFPGQLPHGLPGRMAENVWSSWPCSAVSHSRSRIAPRSRLPKCIGENSDGRSRDTNVWTIGVRKSARTPSNRSASVRLRLRRTVWLPPGSADWRRSTRRPTDW